MTQIEKARDFRALHRPGDPLVLYNVWDAGGAEAIARAGAPAIATASWSVAAAQGFEDGQAIPFALLLGIVSRMAAAVDLPVSVDFEGGYAKDTDKLQGNLRQLVRAGAIGINFEDRVIGGSGLYPLADQEARITALRHAADREGVPLFINARTDLFLEARPDGKPAALIEEAKTRAAAYAAAGADGLFVPGLTDADLIGALCRDIETPVNVMMTGDLTIGAATQAGVSRISFGPASYAAAMNDLAARYRALNLAG